MLSMKSSITMLSCAVALMSTSSAVFADATEQRRDADCCESTQVERQIIHKEKKLPTACSKDASKDVSWGSWLVGNSRSTQFHYLDLLELLFRNDEPAVAAEPSSYK